MKVSLDWSLLTFFFFPSHGDRASVQVPPRRRHQRILPRNEKKVGKKRNVGSIKASPPKVEGLFFQGQKKASIGNVDNA